MPWKSAAQRRWGNSPSGHEALGDAGVNEWNAASKGQKVPEKVAPAMPPEPKKDGKRPYGIARKK